MKEFDEYQAFTRTTDIYPDDKFNIGYKALGLAGEAGEVSDKIKKIFRDKAAKISSENKEAIAKELGDVLWYTAALSTAIGYNLSEIAAMNYDKLSKRKAENKIHGSGDNR